MNPQFQAVFNTFAREVNVDPLNKQNLTAFGKFFTALIKRFTLKILDDFLQKIDQINITAFSQQLFVKNKYWQIYISQQGGFKSIDGLKSVIKNQYDLLWIGYDDGNDVIIFLNKMREMYEIIGLERKSYFEICDRMLRDNMQINEIIISENKLELIRIKLD